MGVSCSVIGWLCPSEGDVTKSRAAGQWKMAAVVSLSGVRSDVEFVGSGEVGVF